MSKSLTIAEVRDLKAKLESDLSELITERIQAFVEQCGEADVRSIDVHLLTTQTLTERFPRFLRASVKADIELL